MSRLNVKGSHMLQSEMNDIMTVLAVGIFADKKIHSSEIKVFIKSVSSIKLSHQNIPKISEAKALTWFEMNKDLVREKFEGPRPEFDKWLIPILERVGEHADKDAFRRLLNEIFMADNEVHISEAALMVLVERVWGLTAA